MSDQDEIRVVTEEAFRGSPHSDHTEQFIIESLRNTGNLTVSLVAEIDGKVVGHVAASPVSISDGATGWYGLGPISVFPIHQGKGIGSMLMEHALNELKDIGASGCVLLGDPNYYSRFGFNAEGGLIFSGVPPEYFQAIMFTGELPKGEVIYHESFYGQC